MAPAALLALALAAQVGDPCVATDGRGRPFRVCFDPGNGLDLSVGGAWGGEEPVLGGATDLRVGLRWRKDLRTREGDLEWLRDMAFLEARALLGSGEAEPRAARALLWRGVFVRRRASPFLLIPGPRPLRFPFPFDVGVLVEVGRAAWERPRPRDAVIAPIRSALLLDLGGRGPFRRFSFGPEVSWTVHVSESEDATHAIVPFTGGVVDARAESGDGLSSLGLAVRGGASLSASRTDGYVDASLALERVVLAVNDRPLALFAEGTWRGGASGHGGEVAVGLRAGLGR